MSPPLEAAAGVARHLPAVQLLMAIGSRARGDARPDSDWDFAYLARPDLDELSLRAGLVEALGSERLDLVDLARAGGLIRYHAARDGVVLFEREPRLAERFRIEAAGFWCDMGSIIRQAYDATLARLDR